MNSLITILLGLLQIALICITATLGLAFAEIVLEYGPTTYLVAATCGSVLCALLTYFIASMAIDVFSIATCSEDRNKVIACAVSAILFVVSMTFPIMSFHGMRARAVDLIENSNSLQQTALTFFYKVDADNNGTITDQELEQAINTSRLSPKEISIANDIKDRKPEVGHVIDQQTHVMPAGKTCMVYTTYTYGITSQDLDTYPSRIRDRYKHWLR